MKLSYRILWSLLAALVPIMALWVVLFYSAMIGEINDEADDSLQDYAELIISRCNEGRPLPSLNSGSNNSYMIEPIDESELALYEGVAFCDREVYIPEKRETEPARVMTRTFTDRQGRHYRLEVAMPTFEKEDLRETILYWVVSLFALLLVVVVVISSLVFRGAMRPLYALLRWLDGYVPGKGVEPVPNNTSVEEFCRLNQAAQSAVDRWEELMDRQRQFTGNASHELQTPLAVIGNRVDYLIDHTSPSEEQLRELAKIQQSLRHSVRLNRTLLMLARIDSGQVAESSEVDIASLVEDVRLTLGEVYEYRSLSCSQQGVAHHHIYINEALARTLVTNLLKNAYIYTEEGGAIEVELTAERLMVSNSGKEPLERDRVFDRFYTHTSREGSTGLGLAIVKSICDHYGYDIEYDFSCDKHHFTIRF